MPFELRQVGDYSDTVGRRDRLRKAEHGARIDPAANAGDVIVNLDRLVCEFSKRRFSSRKRDQLSSRLDRDIAVNSAGAGMFVPHQKECGACRGVRFTRGDNAAFDIQDEQCLQLDLWSEAALAGQC